VPIDPMADVLICQNCGCGFLVLPKDDNGERGAVHNGPLWATLSGPISKDGCWGPITAMPRAVAILRAQGVIDDDDIISE
jgi:hypothetical protein